MGVFEALILGLVEGLTEFLPVSSTGHLILARDVLGLPLQYSGLAFDAVLNMAAVAAVLVYFFRDIIGIIRGTLAGDRTQRTLLIALIVGTIPAALVGYLIEDTVATVFRGAMVVALGLIAGSLLFYAAERVAKQTKELSVRSGLGIGLFQMLALIPGMSRSGMSIAGGLFLGLTREEATRFAFLLSAPLIFGAGAKGLLELFHSGELSAGGLAFPLAIAAATAFLSGLGAIHFLLKYLRTHSLMPFIWYRLALAAVIIVWSFYIVAV